MLMYAPYDACYVYSHACLSASCLQDDRLERSLLLGGGRNKRNKRKNGTELETRSGALILLAGHVLNLVSHTAVSCCACGVHDRVHTYDGTCRWYVRTMRVCMSSPHLSTHTTGFRLFLHLPHPSLPRCRRLCHTIHPMLYSLIHFIQCKQRHEHDDTCEYESGP